MQCESDQTAEHLAEALLASDAIGQDAHSHNLCAVSERGPDHLRTRPRLLPPEDGLSLRAAGQQKIPRLEQIHSRSCMSNLLNCIKTDLV